MVGIEISADFGHFSHPATIYSSLTYPAPPKTTVMGMLAAIMGVSEYLFLNDIKYACIVKNLEGKRNFCFNGIKDALKELNLEKVGAGFDKGRKQFYRELLINPSYEIYVDLSHIDCKESKRLIELLECGKSMYQLYMGINLCLAKYRFLGVFESTETKGDAYVDSLVPLGSDFEIEVGKNYTDIRFATTVQKGRIFGGFCDFLVETSGQAILCKDISHSKVNDKRVVFI